MYDHISEHHNPANLTHEINHVQQTPCQLDRIASLAAHEQSLSDCLRERL